MEGTERQPQIEEGAEQIEKQETDQTELET